MLDDSDHIIECYDIRSTCCIVNMYSINTVIYSLKALFNPWINKVIRFNCIPETPKCTDMSRYIHHNYLKKKYTISAIEKRQ